MALAWIALTGGQNRVVDDHGRCTLRQRSIKGQDTHDDANGSMLSLLGLAITKSGLTITLVVCAGHFPP
jgi:hypothetical protein